MKCIYIHYYFQQQDPKEWDVHVYTPVCSVVACPLWPWEVESVSTPLYRGWHNTNGHLGAHGMTSQGSARERNSGNHWSQDHLTRGDKTVWAPADDENEAMN